LLGSDVPVSHPQRIRDYHAVEDLKLDAKADAFVFEDARLVLEINMIL